MPLTLGLPPCRSPFLRAWTRSAGSGPDWAAWWTGSRAWPPTSWRSGSWCSTGPPMHGFCSLVLPVRTAGGRPAVLKVAFTRRRVRARGRSRCSAGTATAPSQLLRADPHRRALLLERLHPEDLADLWDVEACEVVAGLYARLHVPALPQLRTLTSYVERWAAAARDLPRNAPVPRRLVEQALVARPRPGRGPGEHRHAGPRRPALRERAGRRPRAVAGDRPQADERRPALRAGADAVEPLGRGSAGDVRDGVRRRFHTLVDAAGLDEDRARDWVVVRMVLNAHWSVQDAERGRPGPRARRAGVDHPVHRDRQGRPGLRGPGPSARRAGTSALPGSPGGGLPRE